MRVCMYVYVCICMCMYVYVCIYIRFKTFEYDKMFNYILCKQKTNCWVIKEWSPVDFTFKQSNLNRTVSVDSIYDDVSMATLFKNNFQNAYSLNESNKHGSSGKENDAMYCWRVFTEVL